MFAAIDVNIRWRHTLVGCRADGIQFTFSDRTPETFRPGALAYALPDEGTYIRVFYDRNLQAHETRQTNIMAHVLVHEITHILQGVSRHSESGIMKARWDRPTSAKWPGSRSSSPTTTYSRSTRPQGLQQQVPPRRGPSSGPCGPLAEYL
jgi:hypothetical protein